eukprot:TRINITY_DN10436_c0_g3_i1.p2 TRINITY_DN10436_c0_g3~~TRINITY_DN10436_c0_g3_i1.p2  ORF type:complete len:378 (+),score=148.09 TRINITY_DN10436_c0_g3_i1:35-1168(+)
MAKTPYTSYRAPIPVSSHIIDAHFHCSCPTEDTSTAMRTGSMKLGRLLFGAGVGMGSSAMFHGASATECGLSFDLLSQQNSSTSNEVIRCMERINAFAALSEKEGRMIVQRDEEDEQKLWKGIEISIARGVLKPIPPPHVTRIDVFGKTPDQISDFIISKISCTKAGSVVVLQGQSGTGKGTTTATLLEKLPNSVSWSNGNVFRSLTLLAATHCKNEGLDLKTQSAQVLTPENVAQWMSMLRFEKVADRKYDIVIEGLGINARVSEVQNTVLKEPLVAKNIPTVAEQTQGDVVKFASKALEQMAADGMNVVLEGRAATVQYVPTPYRFELVIHDPKLLGQRRAAQRVMAAAYDEHKGGKPSQAEVLKTVEGLCQKWA